jgi:hypothetical protein
MQKEAENKLKCRNARIEIQRMWNRKCFVMPVIIEAFKYRFKKNVWKQYQDNILYKKQSYCCNLRLEA